MKKLITIILILALLLPVSSLADTKDPIIGDWYLLLNVKGSVFEQSLPNVTKMLIVLSFDESGNMVYNETDYYDNATFENPMPSICGAWKKSGNEYSVSIIASGTGEAFFEDGMLYIAAFGGDILYAFRKLEPIDIFNEIRRR